MWMTNGNEFEEEEGGEEKLKSRERDHP